MLPFVPLGMALAKLTRNANDDGNTDQIKKHTDRGRSIIDKMTAGGADAPVAQWTEAKLEKMIRRNSVFRDYANELRTAQVRGKLGKLSNLTSIEKEIAQATRASASVPGGNAEEDEDANDPDVLAEELIEVEAAEAKGDPTLARESALEALADNSFDAILITDEAGIIAYSNKAFTKLTGYDQADVLGKSPKLLQGAGTDQKVLKRLKESMKKGRGDYEGSAINYRKNGTPFIMHWRVVPVKVLGEIKAWVAIQREGAQIPREDMDQAAFNLDAPSLSGRQAVH